jgi:FtsP/CotA-like multicopper oxidase with cupredoxin domain
MNRKNTGLTRGSAMKIRHLKFIPAAVLCAMTGLAGNTNAAAFVQCPGDTNGDAIIDQVGPAYENVRCMHLTAGDGFIKMADGRLQYMFGFADVTGTPETQAIDAGTLAAAFPAPTIVVDEGNEFFLTLTNVGMIIRPDLADPHTVHFHGFPNASDIFDGVPDATISINMGASLTYYYNLVQPGTYMYHCHVEAAEHMQMGMLGNLYVRPAQNNLPAQIFPNGFPHQQGNTYVYNDGDGSTYYDVEAPIQLGSFDPEFHDASMNVQPLPFANMKDTYAMLNGRGYPDTVNTGALTPPPENGGKLSQVVSSLVTANAGEKILLRISNLNITNTYTLAVNGMTMKVVGHGARLLRGPDGKDLYYDTNSVTLGGGESADVIIDTAGVTPGTYFLYTSNLNYLSNNDEDFGGMMTEIVIN